MSNVKGYSNELYNHDDLKIVYDKKKQEKNPIIQRPGTKGVAVSYHDIAKMTPGGHVHTHA